MQVEIEMKPTVKHTKQKLYKPPPPQDDNKNYCKLIWVILISFVFIAGEFIGGKISGSLSVISDAFHLVTDLLGFIISFIFIYFSRKKPNKVINFGYHRLQVIGALGNLFIIWFLAIFLIYEATIRIIQKQFVGQPLAMLIVGCGGLVINIIMYFVLHTGGHSHGLMSQQCDHKHDNQQKQQNLNESQRNCCSQAKLCQDQICLDLLGQQHCHIKVGKQEEIHMHLKKIKNRKYSEDRIEKQKLEKQFKQHVHNQNCKVSENKNPQKSQQNKEQQSKRLNDKEIKGESQHHMIKQNMQENHKQQQHNHDCKGHDHHHDEHKGQHKKQHIHSKGCNHEHQDGNQHEHNHDHKDQHNHNDHDSHNHNNHQHKHGDEHDHDHQHKYQNYDSIGMKAAITHALSDVIQSIGLLISSLLIYFLGSNRGAEVTEWNDWHYVDPITVYIFSVIVIISTWPVLKSCYYIIMESTPNELDLDQLQLQLSEYPGVVDVHDLHVWDLRPGKKILIAHVFAVVGSQRSVLVGLTEIARRKNIYHSTFQVEQQELKSHNQYILCDHDIHE